MKISKAMVKAFVYRDHMGEGWYAYYPSTYDSLDAGGSMGCDWFETQSEAECFVRKAIEIAASRPRDTALGMSCMPTGIWPELEACRLRESAQCIDD